MSEDSRSITKIFLTPEWYLAVDSDGYSARRYFEGALGCVVEILHVGGEDRVAMKLPRLRADTVQENAYIDELTRQEEEVVYGQFENQDELLSTRGPEFALREERNLKRAVEGYEQHEHLILVRFEKGLAPQFCSVGFGRGGRLECVPPLDDLPAEEEIRKLFEVREEALGRSREQTQGTLIKRGTGLPQTHVCELTDGKSVADGARTFPLAKARERVHFPAPWYAFVPSIVYRWAPINLQQALCERASGAGWELEDHLVMVQRLLTAVDALHAQGAIHADIRPANVMCTGDPSDPQKFVLGDYGSLSYREPGIGGEVTGMTTMGPRVGSERHSPFYSPERGTANEVESADTALVWRRDEEIRILLGWNKSLINADGSPSERKLAVLEQLSVEAVEDREVADTFERLQREDRIRLRDYVFSVDRELRIDGDRVIVCSPVFSRVYHGHLVVREYDDVLSFAQPELLRIPSVIEMKKWSAATDLYGVGALALYSLFRGALARRGDATTSSRSDFEFSEMIRHLESRTYFHSIWESLDVVCANLDAVARAEIGETSEPADAPNHAHALEVVSTMTRSVPGLKRVCSVLDNNLYHFLLSLHFILACLHRQSHLLVPKSEAPERGTSSVRPLTSSVPGGGPFCEDRLQEPGPEGPAHEALARLTQIRKYVSRGVFLDSEEPDEEIPDYQDPLKVDVQNLSNQLDQRNRQLAQLLNEARELGDYIVPNANQRTAGKELRNIATRVIQRVETVERELREAEATPTPGRRNSVDSRV